MLVWSMSIRETIELYGLQNADQYMEVLSSEFGVAKHPRQ